MGSPAAPRVANTPKIANAAVVPVGTGGAITVQADAVGIELIIDVNGYYDNSGVITAVTAGTGLTGPKTRIKEVLVADRATGCASRRENRGD